MKKFERPTIGSRLTILSFLVVGFVAQTAYAQTQYGRNSATGTWSDANWISEFGTTFSSPSAVDDVFIGDATTITDAVEPASVTVGSSHQIDSVTLGNTNAGNMTINGSGSLTVAKDVLVKNGLFDLQSGGSVAADRLFFDGANAAGTLFGSYTANTVVANNGASLLLNSAPSPGASLSSTNGAISINATSSFQGLNTVNANANINAATTASQAAFIDTTTVINANLDVAANFDVSGGLNWNAGAITANNVFFRDGNGGTTLALQRSGGSLTATNLSVLTGITFDVEAVDSFDGLTLSNGAVVNLNRAMGLSGSVRVNAGSTLNLDGNLTSSSLALVGPGAVLNRASGNQFSVGSFTIEAGNYTYDGTDSISESLSAFTNANVEIDASLSLSGLLQTFNGNVEINAAADVGSVLMFGGTITANESGQFGDGTLFGGSEFVFNQQLGETTGVTFDGLSMFAGSLMEINLGTDSSAVDLDWGLRVAGDRQADLQSLLDNGQMVVNGGTGAPIELVFDTARFGNYTYLGFTAVPEPSSMTILLGIICGSVLRRRKK